MGDTMMLAVEAKKRIDMAKAENQALSETCKAQNVVIEDLMVSIPDADDLRKDIASALAELQELSLQVEAYQQQLISVMQSSVPKQPAPPGEFLKNILTHYQESLSEMAKSSRNSVSVLEMVQLEDQISDVIDNIYSKSATTATSAGQQECLKRRQDHNVKILELLRFIQAQNETKS